MNIWGTEPEALKGITADAYVPEEQCEEWAAKVPEGMVVCVICRIIGCRREVDFAVRYLLSVEKLQGHFGLAYAFWHADILKRNF